MRDRLISPFLPSVLEFFRFRLYRSKTTLGWPLLGPPFDYFFSLFTIECLSPKILRPRKNYWWRAFRGPYNSRSQGPACAFLQWERALDFKGSCGFSLFSGFRTVFCFARVFWRSRAQSAVSNPGSRYFSFRLFVFRVSLFSPFFRSNENSAGTFSGAEFYWVGDFSGRFSGRFFMRDSCPFSAEVAHFEPCPDPCSKKSSETPSTRFSRFQGILVDFQPVTAQNRPKIAEKGAYP